MNFKNMTIEELETRKAAIGVEMEKEGADLNALLEEIRGINEELETRKADAKKREEIRKHVATGAKAGTPAVSEPEKKSDEEIRSSKAYVEAFANYIKTGNDKECRALLTTLVSGSVPVPTIIESRVRTNWERSGLMALVRKTYIKGILQVGFEKSASAAVVHTEGTTAPDEENLVLGVVTLTPASIKKWISISDEALDLSGEEFLFYVYDELTHQIAKKAQSELIAKITALTASATTAAVGVGIVAGTPTVGLIASAIGELSDEAPNPVIVMNKGSWAQFKAAQYANSYNVDPFEGLDVHFESTLPVYATTGTAGAAWAIVGDFGEGAHANFPNGDEITIKYDELSLAEKDLVKLVGREYIGLGIVKDHAFCKITFPSA